jgi:hypothetical protein
MAETQPDTPVSLLLPMGVLALVHALALAIGTRGTGPGSAFGGWGTANLTAALIALVAFALILRRHRDGRDTPDPVTLAWALAAADLGAMVIAALVLRPWG